MGRAPCCDKASVKRGPWSPDEDETLKSYVEKHGTGGNWISLPQRAGLKRCGKSCRLRWLNYLRPGIKHGGFSEEEDNVICSLFQSIGSRWSVIASHLPGRTDNDVKNYWNTKLKKKMLAGQPDFYSNASKNDSLTYQTRSSPLLLKSEEFVFGPFSMSNDRYGGFGSFSMSNENSSSSTLTTMEGGLGFDSLSQDLSSSSLSTESSNGYGGGLGIDAFLMDLGLMPADLLSAGGFNLLG